MPSLRNDRHLLSWFTSGIVHSGSIGYLHDTIYQQGIIKFWTQYIYIIYIYLYNIYIYIIYIYAKKCTLDPIYCTKRVVSFYHCLLSIIRFVGKWMSRKERIEQLGDAPRKFTNVYVKNFGEDFTDEDMKKLFEPFGEIQSMKVMRTEDGKSRGFGFVSFSEPESASQVNDEEWENISLHTAGQQVLQFIIGIVLLMLGGEACMKESILTLIVFCTI